MDRYTQDPLKETCQDQTMPYCPFYMDLYTYHPPSSDYSKRTLCKEPNLVWRDRYKLGGKRDDRIDIKCDHILVNFGSVGGGK